MACLLGRRLLLAQLSTAVYMFWENNGGMGVLLLFSMARPAATCPPLAAEPGV